MTIAALVILSAFIGAMTGAFVTVIVYMYFNK